MSIITDQDCPVLRRIRILIDLLGNYPAQPGLLSEPLARAATHRMPTNLDRARWSLEAWLPIWNHVGLTSQADSVF